MKFLYIYLFLFVISPICGQSDVDMSNQTEELPFSNIEETPDKYTAQSVIARMIDGLGFRYYWATEGLTDTDLAYKPSEDGRTTEETLDHMHSLAMLVMLTIKNEPRIRGEEKSVMAFEEMRKETLGFLKEASDILKTEDPPTASDMNIIFQRGEVKSEFPLWNLLNGPLADALWHTGQIVSFRRASGNPYNPKVNVFMGKLRE